MKFNTIALFASVAAAVAARPQLNILPFQPRVGNKTESIPGFPLGLVKRQGGCPTGWSNCGTDFCNAPQTVCCSGASPSPPQPLGPDIRRH